MMNSAILQLDPNDSIYLPHNPSRSLQLAARTGRKESQGLACDRSRKVRAKPYFRPDFGLLDAGQNVLVEDGAGWP